MCFKKCSIQIYVIRTSASELEPVKTATKISNKKFTTVGTLTNRSIMYIVQAASVVVKSLLADRELKFPHGQLPSKLNSKISGAQMGSNHEENRRSKIS